MSKITTCERVGEAREEEVRQKGRLRLGGGENEQREEGKWREEERNRR